MNSFIVISYALTAALFSTQAVGALINARDTTPRIVFAHLIVGNTYPYTLQHWMNDINLAHAYGIDAFALNIGLDTWEPDRVKDACVHSAFAEVVRYMIKPLDTLQRR